MFCDISCSSEEGKWHEDYFRESIPSQFTVHRVARSAVTVPETESLAAAIPSSVQRTSGLSRTSSPVRSYDFGDFSLTDGKL